MLKVTISGNIGCGKSTVIETIQEKYKDNPHFNTFPEPIEKWGEWLEMFYDDPKLHAFPFQMKVLLGFLYLKDKTNAHAITERSPLDSLYVFAKVLKTYNNMSHAQYKLYEEYVHTMGWVPDILIYIQTTPEECYNRLHHRMRLCENGVDLMYLQNIHNAYEVWMRNEACKRQVYYVDGMRDKNIVSKDVMDILDRVFNKKCNL